MIFRLKGRKKETDSDEELVEKFSSTGDLEVLGELYSGYMHLVYGVCLKYLRDRDDAKDAVMQIFEKLVQEIPLHKIENFRSWLHVVTRNHCLMQLRSEKTRDANREKYLNDPYIFMENDQSMHPIDEANPEMDSMLMDCIGRLKGEQKECIMKFYFGNKCYSDIAAELGTEEKKVKSHLQNAKRNLKICLENKNEEREK